MDDVTLATFISLVFTGLFGMGIGYGVRYILAAKQIKSLKADLSRLNQEHINAPQSE